VLRASGQSCHPSPHAAAPAHRTIHQNSFGLRDSASGLFAEPAALAAGSPTKTFDARAAERHRWLQSRREPGGVEVADGNCQRIGRIPGEPFVDPEQLRDSPRNLLLVCASRARNGELDCRRRIPVDRDTLCCGRHKRCTASLAKPKSRLDVPSDEATLDTDRIGTPPAENLTDPSVNPLQASGK
jgi:hypothetical protein